MAETHLALEDVTDGAREDANGFLHLGLVIPSHTRVGGHFAIRPCFINPRTTLADADATVDEVLRVAGELGALA